MPLGVADIAFTPTVRAEQERLGSATLYASALSPDRDGGRSLTEREATFLEARDGMFQATVSETSWPYVQFRGGVPGFLRVLDPQTIAYADYRGNRQYISTGNLRTNPRVAIIAVDYMARKRLKLWGTVEISENARVIGLLSTPVAPPAERAIIIRIEAYDWNCPQHIPVRRTDTEHGGEILRLEERIQALEGQLIKAGISPT
ncbi:pyridoxamine 5'-phosphate oxidase family protein [Roseovarius sp. PS-C2]|uniref:pyridoxamine 5'-phosphate oxidase family protein n=1 Tax=Roseovarius sp. PS-C2 TaxID=2820814 RepID=UPI001C0CB97B|nr:pyridoxamine 5'-phosphate oxidase family protein [Roseovarius sp. PS-C2]MBU3259551.1 pyridoxamine 5'-phosphate oxidase family protein [Roseovarius sp. PS-C2]